MVKKLTPLHDRILARQVEEVGTTRGGIIIPDSAKDKPQEGEVIAVGRGKTNDKGETFPSTLRQAIACCSASTPAPRSPARRRKKPWERRSKVGCSFCVFDRHRVARLRVATTSDYSTVKSARSG